ncbi:hypothetical protein N431DRAFT_15066 [Stipitochalara longipes BDJ]|nr:hypothetical protein N431DRAFT_15066 [Stipitochalara longipes BDJ]
MNRQPEAERLFVSWPPRPDEHGEKGRRASDDASECGLEMAHKSAAACTVAVHLSLVLAVWSSSGLAAQALQMATTTMEAWPAQYQHHHGRTHPSSEFPDDAGSPSVSRKVLLRNA